MPGITKNWIFILIVVIYIVIEPLPSLEDISIKIRKIFPAGIPDRGYFTRESGIKTIFTFVYVNAVEGLDRWLAPRHVYQMSFEQASLSSSADRNTYYIECLRPKYQPIDTPWVAQNTREGIRDETINTLVDLGLIKINAAVPTTSSKPRYVFIEDFMSLFSTTVSDQDIISWQKRYFSSENLAKVEITKLVKSTSEVSITLPNGNVKKMSPGPSSILSQKFIEDFLRLHTNKPAVLWISESGNKVVESDLELMSKIGLPIDQQKLLPDMVVADLGGDSLRLLFIEIVASDGPYSVKRKEQIFSLCQKAGYRDEQITFVSVFTSRSDYALKKRFAALATDSLVWCASEPEVLIWIGKDQEKPFNK